MNFNFCTVCDTFDDAMQVIQAMKVHRIFPNVITCTILVKILGKNGLVDDLKSLFRNVQESGMIETETEEAHETGNENEGGEINSDIKRWVPVVPDIAFVNCVMYWLGKNNMVEDAFCMYEQLDGKSEGPLGELESNARTSAILMQLYVREDDEAGASSFASNFVNSEEFETFIFKSGKMNVSAFNSLINAYAGKGDLPSAFNAFTSMKREGFLPDNYTYNILLNLCGKMKNKNITSVIAKDLERTLMVGMQGHLNDDSEIESDDKVAKGVGGDIENDLRASSKLLSSKVQMNMRLANALIYACTASGQGSLAKYYMDFVRNNYKRYTDIKLTPITRGRYICTLLSTGNALTRKELIPTKDGYSSDLSIKRERHDGKFNSYRNHELAVREFKALCNEIDDPKILHKRIFISLLRSSAIHADVDACMYVLKTWQQANFDIDRTSWIYIMDCLGNDEKHWPVAARIHHHVLKKEKRISKRVEYAVTSHPYEYGLAVGLFTLQLWGNEQNINDDLS